MISIKFIEDTTVTGPEQRVLVEFTDTDTNLDTPFLGEGTLVRIGGAGEFPVYLMDVSGKAPNWQYEFSFPQEAYEALGTWELRVEFGGEAATTANQLHVQED